MLPGIYCSLTIRGVTLPPSFMELSDPGDFPFRPDAEPEPAAMENPSGTWCPGNADSGHKCLYIKNLQYIIRLLPLSMMIPLKRASRVLAFDTSSVRGSVVLLEAQEVLAELRLYAPRSHSTILLSSVNFLLERLGWKLADLSLVATGIGPGSFTGIRIGMATALGIAQALSIPFAGISGLDALAHQVASLMKASGTVGVVLDAHRSQVYYAEFLCREDRFRIARKPALLDATELAQRIAGRHLFMAGETQACGFGSAKSSGWPRILPTDLFLAADIGRLALSRKRAWRSGEYLVSEPLYIRPPDAVRNKGRVR